MFPQRLVAVLSGHGAKNPMHNESVNKKPNNLISFHKNKKAGKALK
jgi:hypothetical protein